MSGRLKAGMLVGAALALSGCAGIPTAVSFAGMYVNSLLVLRTNKGMTDHAVSAAMDQDCGLLNVLEHGAFCIDAPPPQLLAAMSADADMLGPMRAPAVIPVAVEAPVVVEVAAVAPSVAPARPVAGATVAVPVPAVRSARPRAVAAGPSATDRHMPDHFLVVLGSYRNADTAAVHRARLKRSVGAVVAVEIDGETRYRVGLRADSQAEALRVLARARSDGARDAWVTAEAVRPASPPAPPAPPSAPAYAVVLKPLL